MWRETGRFSVQTDGGEVVEIVEYTGSTNVSSFPSGQGKRDTLKKLETRDGKPVQAISKDEFEIGNPGSGIKARRK